MSAITADMPLLGLPLAVVDTETTGLDTTTARIVDVAVVHVDLDTEHAPVVAFSSLVNPGMPIPADSTRITGIDDAMVAGAPTWADVVDRVRGACRGRLVVAHNAPYDYSVLRAESSRLKGETPAPGWVGLPWLCTHVLRRATKTRGRPGRLAEIAAEYGIVLDAHGATGDAMTTAMLVTPLLRRAVDCGALLGSEGAQPPRYPRYGDPGDDFDDNNYRDDRQAPSTVGALLDWQRGAALYQEREWADYRRRQGDVLPPRSPWHELYGVEAPTWSTTPRSTPCPGCGAPVVTRIAKSGSVEKAEPNGNLHHCPAAAGHGVTP